MKKLTWKEKTVVYILLALILIVILVHFISAYYTIDISNILTVIGFLFFIVSAILLYFQIRTGLSFNKRKAAFDFSMTFIAKDLIGLFKDLSEFAKKANVHALYENHPIKDILDGKVIAQEDVPAFKSKIIAILNFYERMAIGIYSQVLDNSICYDDTGFNLIQFFKWVKPFVNILQEQYQEERLFANLEDLFENWHTYYLKVKEKNKAESTKLTRKKIIDTKRI